MEIGNVIVYPAHVLMGIHQHEDYVTREMALDAGQPEMEGAPISGGEEEVWEDRGVVLADDHEREIEVRDERIEQLTEQRRQLYKALHTVAPLVAEGIVKNFEKED